LGAVQGIADLINRPGMINVEFAEVKTVMSEMGMAMMGTGRATGENRAREAAEAAIRSPLLEDVNLQGARGILVNITAGMDLSLGEFSEVGDTVEEFASNDATVVVGTVIDPEMTEELRVTVVATGLGAVGAGAGTSSAKVVVDNTRRSTGQVDYNALDRPTVMRSPGGQASAASAAPARETAVASNARAAVAEDKDMEYLDIPAFLRRQAD